MTIVIADDFTGAAEIAGAGVSFGLKTELQTVFQSSGNAELLVIDTASRSLEPDEAVSKVKKVCYSVKSLHPDFIYKKTDSVLRGNVLAELEAAVPALDKDRALLLPANPSMSRTIRNGRYFIDSVPLEQTDFANDPEHPAYTSDVLELLGEPHLFEVCFRQIPQPVAAGRIAIGQITKKQDLLEWAGKLVEPALPAGGADFFDAILQHKGMNKYTPKEKPQLMNRKKFFVCTSSSEYSRSTINQLGGKGVPVSLFPSEMLKTDSGKNEIVRRWTLNTVNALNHHGMAVASIQMSEITDRTLPGFLCECTVSLIENVLTQTHIDELIIEGGATASAAAGRLGFKKFFPCSVLAKGVVRMQVEKRDLSLTVKPGSYSWPEKMWDNKM